MSVSTRIKSAALRWVRGAVVSLVGRGLAVHEIALARLPEYTRLSKVLQESKINCLIDVGANRGQFALMVRRLGYQGEIHSFEPQGAIFQLLKKRAKDDPRWHCHRIALGEADGQMELRTNQKHSEMTSLYPFSPEYGQAKHELVQVKRLDDFFKELVGEAAARRIFLKTDTEGHDLPVIRGAAGILPSVQALQAEVFVRPIYQGSPHYLEILSEIEAAGFVLEHLAVVSMTNEDRLMCLNALFMRSH